MENELTDFLVQGQDMTFQRLRGNGRELKCTSWATIFPKFDNGNAVLRGVVREGLQTLKKVDALLENSKEGLAVVEGESAKENTAREFRSDQECLSGMVSALRDTAK